MVFFSLANASPPSNFYPQDGFNNGAKMKHFKWLIIGLLILGAGIGLWYKSLAEYQKRRLPLMMPIASIQRYQQLEEICHQAANDKTKAAVEQRFIDVLGNNDVGYRMDVSFDRKRNQLELSTTSFWGYDTCVVPYQHNKIEAPYLKRQWRTAIR